MNLRTGQAAEVTHWRNAVVAAYAVSGIAFATWVSRLPAIRDGLDLTPANVGLLLLCIAFQVIAVGLRDLLPGLSYPGLAPGLDHTALTWGDRNVD